MHEGVGQLGQVLQWVVLTAVVLHHFGQGGLAPVEHEQYLVHLVFVIIEGHCGLFGVVEVGAEEVHVQVIGAELQFLSQLGASFNVS